MSTFDLTNLVNTAKADINAGINTRLDKLTADLKAAIQPAPTPTSIIYDDYSSGLYTFAGNGILSPNGKNRQGYHGINPVNSSDVGKCGVVKNAEGINAMETYAYKYANTTPMWGHTGYKTSSSLVLTEQSFKNFDATILMRTIKSLRTPTPDRWECAWLMWHFNRAGYDILEKGAHFHHYYIMVHTDKTLEFGRKDNLTMTEHQYTLPTLINSAKFAYGIDNKIRVKQVSNHIEIWIDDVKVVDLVDDGTKGTPATDTTFGAPPHPPTSYMYEGQFAYYQEDAWCQWKPLSVTALPAA